MRFNTEKEKGIIPFEYLGVVDDYNGVEIRQTEHYIEMLCENYINRLLRSHGWETPSKKMQNEKVEPDISSPTSAAIASLNALELAYETKMSKSLPSFLQKKEIKDHGGANSNPKNPFHISKRPTPLPSDCIDLMYSEMGPKEGTAHHTALEKKMGFSYRNLLSELMYAYMTCRCDIGYAVTTLSKFSTSPSEFHYKLLKTVTKYLKATASHRKFQSPF